MSTSIRIGDKLKIGNYYESDQNSKEPIEWVAISENGSNILLISKNIIDYREFDVSGKKDWKSSSLRKWLNSDFIDVAFSASEKDAIIESEIKTVTDDTESITQDRVFLLSSNEIREFLSSNWQKAKPTQYAIEKGCTPLEEEGFFTRGCLGTADYFQRESTVQMVGAIGLTVTKTHLGCDDIPVSDGIRPCMWIDINKLSANNSSSNYDDRITEAAKNWFYSEPSRDAMMFMYSVVLGRGGLSGEAKIEALAGKVYKELSLSGAIPDPLLKKVDCKKLAKLWALES